MPSMPGSNQHVSAEAYTNLLSEGCRQKARCAQACHGPLELGRPLAATIVLLSWFITNSAWQFHHLPVYLCSFLPDVCVVKR